MYDFIIIGSGAGGGTLAYRLAPSGKKILIIERGDFLPREKENWDPESIFVKGRYDNAGKWFDSRNKPFTPGQHYFVGGNTKFYGAALMRLRKEDFGEIAHSGGTSPAWPLSYNIFEPYYTEAEKLYQVHGKRGVDPTEPFCSEEYAFSSVKHEPRIEKLSEDLKKTGLNPFQLPMGIMLDEEHKEKSKCIRCNTCDGFSCLVNAKCDAHIISIEPALEYPNVEIMTNTTALRLETGASGKEIKKVIVEREGQEESYSAHITILACGAINSAALLLKSANEQNPEGLANQSGMVGKNLMLHNNSAVVVISREPNDTKFQKTMGINDYYFRSPDWEYPLGHMQMLGKSSGEMFKQEARMAPAVILDKMATHALDFWFTSEDLPHSKNRVTVDKEGSITLQYEKNNTEGHERLLAIFKTLLRDIGCEDRHIFPHSLYLGKSIPLAGVAHQCGTARFGQDPETSVLNSDCRAHEIENLYVVDSSFFVSSGAVNPALTVIANALRVGDLLLEKI